MDTLVQEFANSMNNFKFDRNQVGLPSNRNLGYGYKLNDSFSNPDPPFKSFTSPSLSSSSSEEDYPTGATLKFISDVLMEEDLEGKTCMLQDCLALQAAEKSFYDVLGQEYPADQFPSCFNTDIESLDDCFTRSSTIDSSNSYFIPKASTLAQNSNWNFDQADFGLMTDMQTAPIYSPEGTLLGPDFQSEINPFEVLSGGIGEAGKSLSDGNSLILAAQMSNSSKQPVREERDDSPNSSRGRKSHHRGEGDYSGEERSNKHSALSPVEPEHSELQLFDEVLLCRVEKSESASCDLGDKAQNQGNGNGQRKESNGRTVRGKKKGNKEVVDLDTLLTQCGQAVAIGDRRTAIELLQQIKQHSSPSGDANQRLAHYFADALETRLDGTTIPPYTPMVGSRTTAAQVIKACQVYFRACPFKRMSNFYANRTIAKLAEKATRLHIIDFGVLYGFQWPCLIQRLSERPGGPPKLRITGIDLPQPGFRPDERVQETGRRLGKYCERFDVPFEYNCIAKKWETIKHEDLNIDRDEVTIVNCLYRLKNLPDDTVVANSSRDTVLKLINRIKPDAFIHGAVNGAYNAPFFVTRFREALFHFSSLFDMYEVNVAREDEQRMVFEKESYARDIMNVVACEGSARIERPETYKQWQARNLRAGFRQLPLDEEIFKNVRSTVKSEYNKQFVVDKDGQWMLQGWKGRIINALSVWKPLEE